VSDLFDIEGHSCSLGKPVFKENNPPAKQTAPLITNIVGAGAELVGVSNMSADFLSLHGRNIYYGTPPNPAAEGHITGGCHGGAAAAVAANLVDFSIAAENFGGLRVPSACCGVFGFMASPKAVVDDGVWHGAVNTAALGWMACNAAVLSSVGEVALGSSGRPRDRLKRVLIAEDLFQSCGDEAAAALSLRTLKKAAVAMLGKEHVGQIKLGELLDRSVPTLGELGGPGPFENLQAAYTIVAAYECSRQSMKWSDSNPNLQPAMQEGIDHASQITEEAYKVCVGVMQDVRKVMYMTLNGGTVVALPTIGTPTVKSDSADSVQEHWAVDAIRMCSLAPMAACPQVCMPCGARNGIPLSVSLLGQHKSDSLLLNAAESLAPLLLEEAAKEKEKARPDPEELKKVKAAQEMERRIERAESYKEAGNRAFKEGRFEDAIRDYGRAIETNPKQATYYSNRAMAFLKVMNFNGAEDDCNQALKLELNAKSLLRRGTARLGLNNFEASEKDFKQVIALEPNNRQARVELKNLREARQRFMEMQAAGMGGLEGVANPEVYGEPVPLGEVAPPPL